MRYIAGDDTKAYVVTLETREVGVTVLVNGCNVLTILNKGVIKFHYIHPGETGIQAWANGAPKFRLPNSDETEVL